MADIFVIKRRLDLDDRIFLEGIGQVHELEKVEYKYCHAEQVIANPKNKGEQQPRPGTETEQVSSQSCSQKFSIDRHWRS